MIKAFRGEGEVKNNSSDFQINSIYWSFVKGYCPEKKGGGLKCSKRMFVTTYLSLGTY